MKIVHVIDACTGMYGAEFMLLHLMEEQKGMGIRPVLLSVEGMGEGTKPIEQEAEKRAIAVENFRMESRFRWGDAMRLTRSILAHGADLVHSHSYKTDILLGVLPRHLRKVPTVSTVHGWTAVKKFTKMWIYMYLDKLCLHRMDAVVRVSFASIGGAVHSGASKSKYGRKAFVVENGIPVLSFDTGPGRGKAGEIAEFCNDGFCIGAIGRLSHEKGFQYLIEAVERLIATGNECRAIIIGDGELRLQLENMIQTKNLSQHVLLAGYKENASQYLPLFDVLILPSLTEGLPVTILEAMQAETPIVATRVGGVPEVLADGLYGYLVEPGNADALAGAISRLKRAPSTLEQMTKRAREVAISRYSSKRMAVDYLGVYNSVLENRRGDCRSKRNPST